MNFETVQKKRQTTLEIRLSFLDFFVFFLVLHYFYVLFLLYLYCGISFNGEIDEIKQYYMNQFKSILVEVKIKIEFMDRD